jgi:glucose/arabinose dehydrogenase
MRRLLIPLAAVSLLGPACGGGGSERSPARSTPPASGTQASSPASSSPGGSPDLARAAVRLRRIATVQEPVGLVTRPGDPAMYVVEKVGKILAVRGGRVDPAPVLDISRQVTDAGEQGLLGLAFSPDGAFGYVNFIDTNGDTRVVEFAWGSSGADGSSQRLLLLIHQPASNHNGGDLAFGPDGDLYIGMGDGGSEGDPQRYGQNLSTLLAKMLRIDPRPSGGAAYSVPPDNPFVGRTGIRPEIWAYGLRNPWRFSFDTMTGDLWIGDVGQGQWEEVDLQPAGSKGGQNYGWSNLEGTHLYNGPRLARATPPVFEYSHESGGCAIIGGSVYRGSAIPDLDGAYVFGDLCTGTLTALSVAGGRVTGHRSFPIRVPSLSSFGQDQAGELYAMGLGGELDELVPAS